MKTVLDVKELKLALKKDIFGVEINILRGVSFSVRERESVAIVGESGSGKTLTAMAVVGLVPDNMSVTKGEVLLCGKDVFKMSRREIREMRGMKAGMIFQEPSSYLNPVFTAGDQIFEAIKDVRLCRDDKKRQCIEILGDVGLPEDVYCRYPHQLSGGQQQRVMIAMALINKPSILIADEPTTALDVTTSFGIIELLKALIAKYGLSLLFITHDISLVAGFADKIAVMYAGRVVEVSDAKMAIEKPAHPYTEKLIACLPERYTSGERIRTIEGNVPDFRNISSGCAFHPRCPYAMDICRENEPAITTKEGFSVRCFRYGKDVEYDKCL